MPLYEYCCKKCGKRIERIQKFSDAPLNLCEECGGELEKMLSAPAIRFKGSGWYVNDYAGKKSDPDTKGGEAGNGLQPEPKSPEKAEPPPKPSSSPGETSSNKPKVA